MEDHRLIQLAIERAFMTPRQLEHLKAEAKLLADRGIERSLWFLAQDMGFVSEMQAKQLRSCVSSARVRALEVEGYVIQGRIGSGGMGDVFRGRNGANEDVAIKLLSSKYSQNEEYARRFQREARATLRLDHPHITRSLSAGEMEGQRYLLMELVHGPSLKQHIQAHGPLSEAHALILLAQMARALRYAWSNGILHRDVKPANIILAPPRPGTDEPFCAKLCDFGLAKTLRTEDTVAQVRGELTQSGVAIGTPHYMSPEQASGEHDLDQRTDIYGLGATLYHTLIGETMYSGQNSAAIMYKQVTETLDLQAVIDRKVSEGTVRMLTGMLAKQRGLRFASWDTVLIELRRIAPLADPGHRVTENLARVAPEAGTASNRRVLTARLPSPRRLSTLATVAIAALASLVVVGISFVILGGSTPPVLRATPETLGSLLARGRPPGVSGEILLAAGDYRAPWRFDAAHSGLHLVASEPGVRLVGVEAQRPLLLLTDGAQDVQLRGLVLVGAGGLAIDAMAGTSATLVDCSIEKCRSVLASHGADVRITGMRAFTEGPAVVCDEGARLQLDGCVLGSPAPVVEMQRGNATLRRCQFQPTGSGDRPVLLFTGGSVAMQSVVVEAGGGDAAVFDTASDTTLREVTVRNARVGMRFLASRATVFEGITIDAGETGIEWAGPWDQAWSWKRLRLSAPVPTIGLPAIATQGVGLHREPAVQGLAAVAP